MLRFKGDLSHRRPIRLRPVLDRRDRLLAETQWTQLPGSGLTPLQKAAWDEYRAKLWAIRPEEADPHFPDWPGEAKLRGLKLAEDRPASINYEIDWRLL